jgi:membrane protein DedA with SNARE-associated domain
MDTIELVPVHVTAGAIAIAFFIAAASFFLGPVRRIPEPLRIPALRLIPLVVLVTMAYWLWRYRRTRTSRSAARVIAPEAVQP